MPQKTQKYTTSGSQTAFYEISAREIEVPDAVKKNIKLLKPHHPEINIPLSKRLIIGGIEMFYIIETKPEGKTPKLNLMRASSAETKISQLVRSTNNHSFSASSQQKQVKFEPEAILKLPKPNPLGIITDNSICDVQREQIALDISSILSFQTTNAKILEYEGKPALLVYFDPIKPLSHLCNGVEKKAYSLNIFNDKTYLDEGTFKAVGENIEPETFIREPGLLLAFFYLCNDPDAIGKNFQNLALRDEYFYIFDKLFKVNDCISLDSGFNFKRTGLESHGSRHFMFRNKQLISCSPVAEKLKSICILLDKVDQIIQHIEHIIQSYPENHSEHSENINLLRKDAENIKNIINERIAKLQSKLPKVSGKGLNNAHELLSREPAIANAVFILAKLLERPVLFHKDGRPYQLPWVDEESLRIEKPSLLSVIKHPTLLSVINIELGERNTLIQFDANLNEKYKDQLQWIISKAGLEDHLQQPSDDKLLIDNNSLLQLTEMRVYPECRADIDLSINYLEKRDLIQIGKHYSRYQVSEELVKKHIMAFESIFNRQTNREQLINFQTLMSELKNNIGEDANLALTKHLLKRYCYGHLQSLCKQHEGKIAETIQQGFNIARKLDRIFFFTQTLLAMSNTTLHMEKLLQNIIQFWKKNGDNIREYQSALSHSEAFQRLLEGSLKEHSPLAFSKQRFAFAGTSESRPTAMSPAASSSSSTLAASSSVLSSHAESMFVSAKDSFLDYP